MIPVTEICVRIFWRLPSVANESLAAQKNATKAIKVTNGATLRSRSRSQSSAPPLGDTLAISGASFMPPPASGPC